MKTKFSLTDPLPFFLHDNCVLYLAAENPYLFSVPLADLRAFQAHEDEVDVEVAPDEVEIDPEAEELEERMRDPEAEELEELERMRGQPHPLGRVTTCVSIADRHARELLAAAEVLELGDDQVLREACSTWADYCDFVSDEVANSEPLEDVLARPWPHRPLNVEVGPNELDD